MILTCPQCRARFQLPSDLLGEEGRNVRCSSCKSTWFQTPHVDTSDDGGGEGDTPQVPIEDIPDGVKPIPDGGNVPALAPEANEDASIFVKNRGVIIGSLLIGLVVFIATLTGLVAFKTKVIAIFPESYVFYQTLGLVDHVPGQGLVFDKLSAVQDGDVYRIEGHIINLTSGERLVPLMEASLIAEDGTIKESWIIEPPQRTLAKEKTLAFRADYKPQSATADHTPLNVFLRFVIKP